MSSVAAIVRSSSTEFSIAPVQSAGVTSESRPDAGAKESAWCGRRQRHHVGSLKGDGSAGGNRRRELKRLEVDERRLVVERRLEEVDVRLEKIPLRLRHQKARRQASLVTSLLVADTLLGERRAGSRGIFAFRGA